MLLKLITGVYEIYLTYSIRHILFNEEEYKVPINENGISGYLQFFRSPEFVTPRPYLLTLGCCCNVQSSLARNQNISE